MQIKPESVQKSLEESDNTTLLDAVGQDQAQADEFATPATLFGLYTPQYEERVNNLSTGELRRLAKGIVMYPLNEKEFLDNSSSKVLKEAFAIGDKLIQAKMAMMLSFIYEQEKLKSAQQNNQEAAQVASNETEKTDGEVQT